MNGRFRVKPEIPARNQAHEIGCKEAFNAKFYWQKAQKRTHTER